MATRKFRLSHDLGKQTTGLAVETLSFLQFHGIFRRHLQARGCGADDGRHTGKLTGVL